MRDVIKGLTMAVLLAGAAAAVAESETREVGAFDRVAFALPGKLILERGDRHQVVIDAAPEDLERIVTRSEGGVLAVRWQENSFGIFGGRPEGPISVRVTLPELKGLELAGSGDAEGGSWMSETFTLEVNGSGNARFGELATEELTLEVSGSGSVQISSLDAALARIEISGSGDVELAGAADRQEIELMGSGDVSAAELEGARVSVEIMGSGDVEVWANETLSAEVMGSGDVRYRGSPQVDSEEHGSGEVRAL